MSLNMADEKSGVFVLIEERFVSMHCSIQIEIDRYVWIRWKQPDTMTNFDEKPFTYNHMRFCATNSIASLTHCCSHRQPCQSIFFVAVGVVLLLMRFLYGFLPIYMIIICTMGEAPR